MRWTLAPKEGWMSGSGKAGELAGVHVLVVDDDRDSLEMMQTALSHAGALVTAVDSARHALAALDGLTPGVIVSDLRMPDADGLSFARQLRQMPALRAVPLLAVTGYDEHYTRSDLHAAGFIGILRKPLAFFDLVRTVAALADAGGLAER